MSKEDKTADGVEAGKLKNAGPSTSTLSGSSFSLKSTPERLKLPPAPLADQSLHGVGRMARALEQQQGMMSQLQVQLTNVAWHLGPVSPQVCMAVHCVVCMAVHCVVCMAVNCVVVSTKLVKYLV